jgi:hypothetical protein
MGQTEDNQAVLKKIFADWKERQGLFKIARYAITGATEYKDKELPAGNPVRPTRSVLLLDFERNRWRGEGWSEDISANGGKGLTYVRMTSTTAFNGKAVQTYYHRDLNRIEVFRSRGRCDSAAPDAGRRPANAGRSGRL